MIDLKRLRDAPEEFKAAAARRDAGLVSQLDDILKLDLHRRALVRQVEALKADRNHASEEVAHLKRQRADTTELLARLKDLSKTIKNQDQELREADRSLKERLLGIPNPPLESVPEGDASANQELRSWGELPRFTFEPKPHWELGETLGILDLARGAKVTGSGFPFYIG